MRKMVESTINAIRYSLWLVIFYLVIYARQDIVWDMVWYAVYAVVIYLGMSSLLREKKYETINKN